MKKKFSLEIKTPCHENFNSMLPNASGSFCNSCAKNVIDLSTKTNSEVVKFISENKDKNICARLRTAQLEEEFEFDTASKSNNLKYVVAVAASILLTSNVVAQENQPPKTEQTQNNRPVIMGKMIAQHNKVVSILLKGKVLDRQTKKPVSVKRYPNLYIYTNGTTKNVKIDETTGAYSLDVLVNEKDTKITIYINNEDVRYSKEFPINTKEKTNVLEILVDPENDFQSLKIMGGMGVNYSNDKKNNLS